MSRMQANHFQFVSAESGVHTTVLNAVMSDFSYARHAHEELAIGVTLHGVQEFCCNGSQYRSSPGNIILFNPGDVHTGNPGNDDALKYVMLYLDTVDFYPLMGSVSRSSRSEFRFSHTHFKDVQLQSLILEMGRVAKHSGHSTLDHDHCLCLLAERLAKRMGVFQPETLKHDADPLLLNVRDYIHDNVAEDVSIDDLCRIANISKYHFIRLFRSQFGMTPHRFILNHRINRARRDLETGTAPSDVAQNFGFFDVSHLNRHFKRAYGITPKQYQLQLTK